MVPPRYQAKICVTTNKGTKIIFLYKGKFIILALGEPVVHQCWVVLIFLWEPAGFGSYIMLQEPNWFIIIIIIIILAGENQPRYQDF
jgi:hypothetical protein